MKQLISILLCVSIIGSIYAGESDSKNLLNKVQPIGNATFKEFFLPCETPFREKASKLLRVCQLERKECHGVQPLSGIATTVKLKLGQQYCVTAVGKLCDNTTSDIRIFLKQEGSEIVTSEESFTTDLRILTLKFIATKCKACLGLGTNMGINGSFEVHKFTLEKCNPCPFKALNIVLTNDDGFNDALGGIQTLANVFKTAGHNVFIVAPHDRVDGCSIAISNPGMTIPGLNTPFLLIEKQPDAFPGVPTWSVRTAIPNPTPPNFLPGPSAFSAASLAQFPFVVPVQPDLVISGINTEGNNTGPSSLSSGTVGAAGAAFGRGFAHFVGVPAIAVSGPGSPTFNTPVAEFVLSLVTQLQCSEFTQKTGKLLPDFVGLAINYPNTMTPKGVRITRQGLVSGYNSSGIPTGASYTEVFASPTTVVTVQTPPRGTAVMPPSERNDIPDSDSLAVFQGYIAVTPIDPFLSADPCETRQVIDALAQLQPAFGTFVPQTTTFPFSSCKSCKK